VCLCVCLCLCLSECLCFCVAGGAGAEKHPEKRMKAAYKVRLLGIHRIEAWQKA
jgi:hypothetical protein